jgi:hypothetical protein
MTRHRRTVVSTLWSSSCVVCTQVAGGQVPSGGCSVEAVDVVCGWEGRWEGGGDDVSQFCAAACLVCFDRMCCAVL